jgi:PKHD-type hydroxylase
MNKNENMFWQWDEEIPSVVCEAIIKRGLQLDIVDAEVGNNLEDDEGRVDHSVRNSQVGFFNADTDAWLFHLLWGYMLKANINAGWNFDIGGQQPPQFTIYEKDFFYDFHEDGTFHQDGMRKLTIAVQLSNPADYEGGEFVFESGPLSCWPPNQGTIIAFPSFIRHRVNPVTKGIRYTCINWFEGPAFK